MLNFTPGIRKNMVYEYQEGKAPVAINCFNGVVKVKKTTKVYKTQS